MSSPRHLDIAAQKDRRATTATSPFAAIVIAVVTALASVLAVTPSARSDEPERPPRKIPVNRFRNFQPAPSLTMPSAPEKDIIQVAGQSPAGRRSPGQLDPAQQYPIGEQPGQVTGVIITNEAGEVVSGELAEGEFYVGPRPSPVVVGNPLGESVIHEFGPTPAPIPMMGPMMGLPSGAMPIDGSGGCAHCDAAGCDGMCRGRPISPQEARIEAVARVLANPFSDFWARAEYMQLFVDGQRVPALVTTGPVGDLADAGVIGTPGVSVLFGDDELGDDDRSAGRIELGRYLGRSGLAVSASYLFADDVSQSFAAETPANAVLARPFVDIAPGTEGNNSELISFPGVFNGDVSVQSSTQFAAADVLVRAVLISQPDRWLHGFVGYDYLSLDDELFIRDSKRVIGGTTGLALGTTLDESDRFATTNDFHGVALGIQSQTCWGRWSIGSMLKMGLGITDATVVRSGQSSVVVPLPGGGSDDNQNNSGLLVQDSNRGSEAFEEFSIAPELRLVLNRRLSTGWDVSVGYQFIYWSRVLRAGDQIDPLINLTQLSPGGLRGVGRPASTTRFEDMVAHGITFGLSREF